MKPKSVSIVIDENNFSSSVFVVRSSDVVVWPVWRNPCIWVFMDILFLLFLQCWWIAEGELILVLHKRVPCIWNSIFPREFSTETAEETIHFPFVVFFLRQTNRLHIVIQNRDTQLQIRSISFSIESTNVKNPLKPTSNLRIRLSTGSTLYFQDVCVAAWVDSNDGACYIKVWNSVFVWSLLEGLFCCGFECETVRWRDSILWRSTRSLSCSLFLWIITLVRRMWLSFFAHYADAMCSMLSKFDRWQHEEG